ncbi:hypothetical protein ABN763_14250 [Spongiivirga sp. MCCC 1A20706]|uniref:hypothetical protein n=1 Tax=Spongiivirga sp. MCCC 1A20706 TaxID=3160963 RepID=UPI003977828E
MKNLILYIAIASINCSLTIAQKADVKLATKEEIVEKSTSKLPQKRNAVVFNEADMFQMYYSKETKDIQLKKKMILKKIKKGDKKAERDLKELKTTESKLNARNKKALKFARLNEQIYFEIGPIPPCPTPNECGNEWLPKLDAVIVQSLVRSISIEAVNKQGKTIGVLDKKPNFLNKKIGFKTFRFKWKSRPKGPITFKIKKVLTNNLKESYEVNVQ